MTRQTEQNTEAAGRIRAYLDASARYGPYRQNLIDSANSGGGHRTQLLADDLRAVLAALDSARDQPPAEPVAVEVTYGHQAYIFSRVTSIVVQAAPENYSLECAWHTDGTLTIVPSCTMRMVTQAELDELHADAEQRAEEADIMRSAGAYDPDYGKDLDYD